MTIANDLHNKAMESVDYALSARQRGADQEALSHFEEALAYELDAIADFEKRNGPLEPSYSVLHRSAATLALDCGKPRDAEKLAARALAQDPCFETAEELRDVMERATFQRHLQLRGIELVSGEIQMSLAGREVGLGIAEQHEVLTRVGDSFRVMQRIADRRSGNPLREGSGSPKVPYRLYTSLPRAASFAVTLRLATSPNQASLPGMLGPDAVLDEFADLMQLLDSSNTDKIQEMIPDTTYLQNFMALGRKIAPDGERINLVGFTTIRDGVQRSASLTRPAGRNPNDP